MVLPSSSPFDCTSDFQAMMLMSSSSVNADSFLRNKQSLFACSPLCAGACTSAALTELVSAALCGMGERVLVCVLLRMYSGSAHALWTVLSWLYSCNTVASLLMFGAVSQWTHGPLGPNSATYLDAATEPAAGIRATQARSLSPDLAC